MPNKLSSFFDIFIGRTDSMVVVGWVLDIESNNIVRPMTEFLLISSRINWKIQAVCGFVADSTILFKRVHLWNDILGEGGLKQQLKGQCLSLSCCKYLSMTQMKH